MTSHSRTTPLILAVVGAAVAVSLVLPSPAAATASRDVTTIVVLCSLALIAELLSFLLPKGALGSISSMPALAAVLVAPSWHIVAGIAIVKCLVESARRPVFEKAVFNIAQYSLAIGLASLVFLKAGGKPLAGLGNQELANITRADGLAAFLAFGTAFSVNSILVSAVVALASGSRLSSVWRANNIATIGIDIVASPIIFLFAWAYVRFGAVAAAALWIPIIGIRQVYKTNLELEQTNVELLDLMVKSIEARDPYTSGHSRRVQSYSITITRALGLAEREIEMIGRAALLHDVGKIYEKYGPILRKAERLSADEWNTMREHPVDGAELIATMTRLRDLVRPVRHHHENWDGTGYPDAIAGEVIPLASRVIRFADTIDAMTTERPYRPALTSDEVRAEIVKCRGTQFDPQIVDRLLSSPFWKSMFTPSTPDSGRFGDLTILSGDTRRQAKAHTA